VNAREAGIFLTAKGMSASKPATISTPAPADLDVDVRLIHWRMPSPIPRTALGNLLAVLGPISGSVAAIGSAAQPDLSSPEQIYDRERTVVGTFQIVPLVWLPQVYGLSARLRDWNPPLPGDAWPLADVWLDIPATRAGLQ
jgi:hypothetical protein